RYGDSARFARRSAGRRGARRHHPAAPSRRAGGSGRGRRVAAFSRLVICDRQRARRRRRQIGSQEFPMNGLNDLLAAGKLVQAPGASDILTARIVEQAGFPAVYMTGFGATATTLGMPDLGLMTQSEMVD